MPRMSEGPLFIVGCPRSGTTLLRDMIRGARVIAIPPETQFIPSFYEAWGDPGDEHEAVALGRRILSSPHVSHWGLDLGPGDFSECRSFASIVRTLFEAFAQMQGMSRWGDKTPQYVVAMPLLGRLFDDARFVQIDRDGRDVAISWLRTSFTPGGAYGAARGWRRMVRTGHRDGEALGGRYLRIRFEDLVAEPEPVMRRVCDHVGVPFSPAVLRREPRTASYGGLRRSPALPDPAKAGVWREGMPVSDRRVFESEAGDLLEELGYETEGIATPLSPARRALLASRDRGVMVASRLRHRRPSPAHAGVLALARIRSLMPRRG
jgi:hypothetical protein